MRSVPLITASIGQRLSKFPIAYLRAVPSIEYMLPEFSANSGSTILIRKRTALAVLVNSNLSTPMTEITNLRLDAKSWKTKLTLLFASSLTIMAATTIAPSLPVVLTTFYCASKHVAVKVKHFSRLTTRRTR
jgi:hypothetical protein